MKEKLLAIRDAFRYRSIGRFRGKTISTYNITDTGVYYYDYDSPPDNPNRRWVRVNIAFEEFTDEENAFFQKVIDSYYPEKLEVTRDRYLITFHKTVTGESLSVNLKDQKFTKTYKNGKQRDIKSVGTFFKGYLGTIVARDIPSDDKFRELIETIIKKEYMCSNFGTFLIRMFDNIHLETYINLGKKFDYQIRVPYNFFDKDVRAVIDARGMTYNRTIESFFANNRDLGKAVFSYIKDDEDFEKKFNHLAYYMNYFTTLVVDYKYDAKTLYNYCKERDFKSGRGYTWQGQDLLNYMVDYARMADLVYNGEFDKYPRDIKEWHDGVTKLYNQRKQEFDEEKYAKLVNEKMEVKTKKYSIIFPKTTEDIKKEGSALRHCVGSYISYVLQGTSTILFLRETENLDKSLVTLEIRNRAITQARGSCNRAPSYEENQFIKEYAKAKRLIYR